MNYNPKQLSRLQARVLQELVSTKKSFPVSFAGQNLSLVFVEEAPIDSAAMKINLRAGTHSLTVFISPTSEGVITRRVADFGGIEVFAEPFRQALIAVVSKEVLDTLEHVLQLPIELRAELEEAGKEEESKSEVLFFKVHGEDGVLEATGKLVLPSEVIERVLSLAKDLPIQAPVHSVNWFVKGQVVVGTTRLTVGQLSDLSVSSLVLLDEPCALDSGTGRLLIGGDITTTVPLSIKDLQGLVYSFEKVMGKLSASVDRSEHTATAESFPSATAEPTHASEQSPQPQESLPSEQTQSPEGFQAPEQIKELGQPQPLVQAREFGSEGGHNVEGSQAKEAEVSERLLDIEIDLAYVAGEFEMDVGESEPASAKSGPSIPRISYFRPIRILLDEKVIGTGELVQIKRRHAVLITALL